MVEGTCEVRHRVESPGERLMSLAGSSWASCGRFDPARQFMNLAVKSGGRLAPYSKLHQAPSKPARLGAIRFSSNYPFVTTPDLRRLRASTD